MQAKRDAKYSKLTLSTVKSLVEATSGPASILDNVRGTIDSYAPSPECLRDVAPLLDQIVANCKASLAAAKDLQTAAAAIRRKQDAQGKAAKRGIRKRFA